jgi:hypothetical protein
MVELAMVTPPDSSTASHEATHSPGVDLDALRANLRLSPAERIAELVEMNRLHHDIQSRTLSPELRAALGAREVERARARLRDEA